MEPHSTNRWLMIGWAVSLLTHGGLALLLTLESGGGAKDRARELQEQKHPDPLVERVALGEPTSDEMSVSWVGYDTYQKHVARKFTVDQAAQTLERAAPPPAPTRMAQAAVAAGQEAVQRAVESMESAVEQGSGMLSTLAALGEAAAAAETTAMASRAEGQPKEAEQGEPEEADTPADRQAQAAAAPRPPVTPSTGSQAEAPPTNADPSDRESDATSVEDLEMKQLGKPLAAKGLRIKTQRPRLSHYTQLMGRKRSVLLRFHFRADGTPKRVEMLEGSGSRDVDQPVLDAAYRWRATGAALDRLKTENPEGVVVFDVRIKF